MLTLTLELCHWQEWKENPLVKLRLRPKDEDDGTFWMPWDEFTAAGFDKIDICDRTTKRDLRLDVDEDRGFCGIVLGCLKGLAEYICLCQGILVVCAPPALDPTTSGLPHTLAAAKAKDGRPCLASADFGKYSSDKTKSTKRYPCRKCVDGATGDVIEPVPAAIDRA